MKTIVLSTSQWQTIRAALHIEHPKSVFMLTHKMRLVLGFTARNHTEWISKPDGGHSIEQSIRLDFYNERKYTMFILKFSEYL